MKRHLILLFLFIFIFTSTVPIMAEDLPEDSTEITAENSEEIPPEDVIEEEVPESEDIPDPPALTPASLVTIFFDAHGGAGTMSEQEVSSAK